MKRGLFYGLALLVVVLDRLTKAWAVRALGGGNVVPIIPGVLVFNMVHNTGSAFSMFRGGALPLGIVAAVAAGAMVWVERRGLPGPLMRVAMGLMLGGAVGNLIDRLHLRYVIDFVEIDWHGRNVWPVFNVADSAVTVGAILLMLWFWKADAKRETPPA